jgi:hypothetical protein
MKCGDVKKYLSEYIDGKLEGELNEQVEEHLSSCEACSEDLDTIMAIKEQLGKMGEIEVPQDFISSIHKRIEEDSGVKKIFNALFKPARIKIPLELAAGLTAVIVVIVLLNLQPLFKPTGQLAYEKKGTDVFEQKKRDEQPIITETKSYDDKSAGFEEQKAEVKEPLQMMKEEDEVEIASSVESVKRPGTPAEPVPETQSRPEVTRDIEKKHVELALFVKAVPADAVIEETSDVDMAAEGIIAKRAEKRDRLREPSGKEAPMAGGEIKTAIMDLYLKTKELILESGGRVISSELSAETGLPLTASAEIPLENYQSFLDKLKNIADISEPPPPASFPEGKWVQMNIRFYTED